MLFRSGEALAVNSICQLHRLLVDPDAASTSLPSPIDAVLGWVAAMQLRIGCSRSWSRRRTTASRSWRMVRLPLGASATVLERRVPCAGPLWLPDVSVAGWPLFMASVWRTAPANPTVDGVVNECPKREEHIGSGHQQASPDGIPMQ